MVVSSGMECIKMFHFLLTAIWLLEARAKVHVRMKHLYRVRCRHLELLVVWLLSVDRGDTWAIAT